jgi:heme-degrading monooxygenase HmoA
MSKNKLSLLLLLSLSWIAACGDDDKKADPTPDPFVGCTASVFEADLMLDAPQGSVVDPQTYKVTPPAGAFIATTYLPLKSGDATQTRFMELLGPVQQELGKHPGMLAIATSGSPKCGSVRTISVWESEAAMMDFVLSDAHIAAMAGDPDLSRGGTATTSWAHAGGELTWQDAIPRLAE